MNMLLSLLVSIAMLFTGAAELPAVPETAVQYTLSDITIGFNGDSVTLNPSLQFSAAAGSEEIYAALDVVNNDETLLSLAGRMDPEQASFRLSESGRAFSLHDAELSRMMGLEENPEAEKLLSMMVELYSLIPSITLSDSEEVARLIMEDWVVRSGAEAEKTSVELEGFSIPAESVSLELSVEDLICSLDAISKSESEALQRYSSLMLELMGMALGGEYASFSDLCTALVESGEDTTPVLPMEITTAYHEKLSYQQILIQADIEGSLLDAESTLFSNGDMLLQESSCSVDNAQDEQSMNSMQLNSSFSVDGEGNADFSMDMTSQLAFNYNYSDDDGESHFMSVDSGSSFEIYGSLSRDEDGLNDCYASIGVQNWNNVSDGADTDGAGIALSLDLQASDYLDDEGGVSTDCYASLLVEGADGESNDLQLSFTLDRRDIPYANPFAGAEMVQLSADPADESYAQLETELLAPMAGVMALGAEESILELAALFSGEEDASDDAGEDDVYIDEDVDAGFESEDGGEEMITMEEALQIYGGEVPAYTAPEGYTLDYIYADAEYLSLDYASEEGYFSLSMMPDYFSDAEETLFLQSDGLFLAPEGLVVEMGYYEDGTVSYATVVKEGTEVSFYFDACDPELAREIIAGLVR